VSFHPDEVDRFRITSFHADLPSGTATLRYALGSDYEFEERFDFGPQKGATSPGSQLGFERVVRLLHMIAGVSYYKTAAPRRIVIETGELTSAELHLCMGVYDSGLREFAYRNGLNLPRDLEFTSHTVDDGPIAPKVAVEAPRSGVGIPLGGGKDSIVVVEGLKDTKELRPILVSVNPSPAVERIASISGLEIARVKRTLDPLLFDLNAQGALNGHVPVTAIVALASVAAGYVHGYDTTVMALESSADAPTRGVEGTDVNHQWSKSLEFELLLQEALSESVGDSVRFFSPLRKFTELEITAAFARLTPYLSAFRSCNRAFRINAPLDGWCGDCPKCRFVFLALATSLERGEVVRILGSDLLDDPSQVEGFSDMLDATRKPFECVGTVEEVSEAFAQLLADPSWADAVVLDAIRRAPARGRLESRASRVGSRVSPEEVFAEVKRSTTALFPSRREGAG